MSLRSIPVLCLFPFIGLAAPATAQVQQAAPVCAVPADLPPTLASWRKPVAITAAIDRTSADGVVVTPGQAVAMALAATPGVAYPVRPAKPGGADSHGGLATFTVEEGGVWRVALGAGAWVDVVRDGKTMASVAHGHGPECSGIRKMVDYDLTPGRYTLEIAGSVEDRITLLVMRVP